jgi:hypothetical protein
MIFFTFRLVCRFFMIASMSTLTVSRKNDWMISSNNDKKYVGIFYSGELPVFPDFLTEMPESPRLCRFTYRS